MRGPQGALTLITFQIICGTFLLMVVNMFMWRFINRGYFRSTVWVLWPLQAASAFLVPGRLRVLALAVAASYLLFLLAIYSQRPLLEWSGAALTTAASIWLVVELGMGACRPGCGWGVAQALAGMFFLGSVTHGMTLGHWYLNQARLPIEPLKVATWTVFGSLVVSLAAGVLGRSGLVSAIVPATVISVGGGTYWWTWLVLALTTAGLMAMVRSTVWSRSTQSATGLLYIAMVTAIGAQFVIDLLLLS